MPVPLVVAVVMNDASRRQRAASSRLRRSLRTSVFEGMAAELFTMCSGGAVFTAWAKHFHGGPLLVGLLSSLLYLSQVMQFPAAYLTQWLGGRRVALWAVALSRQAVWPLVFLPFAGLSDETSKRVLVTVAAVSAVLQIVGANGWSSWMGDLVPGRIRGRYFGIRTALCTVAAAVGGLSAGVWLDFCRARGVEAEGLSALGLCAVTVGAISTWLMRRQHDPGHEPEPRIDWHRMVRPLREKAMQRLISTIVPWNVGVGLSSSMFTFFMLDDLRMGFALMAAREATTLSVRTLVSPLWGRAIDRVGSRPVLVACSFFITVIPFVWMLAAPDRIWPVFFDSFCSGILWAGHNLATMQMPVSLAPQGRRSWHVASFYACSGLAYATGAILGGWYGGSLPKVFELGGVAWTGFQFMLLLSAALRMTGALLSLRTFEPGSKGVRELATMVGDGANRLLDLRPGGNGRSAALD